MALWLVALAVGAVFAALQYARVAGRHGLWGVLLGALRLASITLLAALLLDAPAGRERAPAPLVALDASRSWTRGDTTRWRTALERARSLGGDSLVLFGDSVRIAAGAVAPGDVASSIAGVAEQAAAQGRPLHVVTDGEVSDASAMDALPRGSRIEVVGAPQRVDLAISAVDAPALAATGDTIAIGITVRSGNVPTPAATLTIRLEGTTPATLPVPALAPLERRELRASLRNGAPEGVRLLEAYVAVAGDAERRNDTVRTALDVSRAAGAVWISSAPDVDGRTALAVLRGALSVPTRAFLRVAPGAWRVDGSLAPVSEADVRAAANAAPLLFIHGDTGVFGPPRALAGTAPLALLPGPGPETTAQATGALDEWYATAAPSSPVSGALGGIAWDSLPPVSLGRAATLPEPAGGDGWIAMSGQRGRRGTARALIHGSESPRRLVVARATGFAAWRARGGASALAHDALWGSLFDWLAEGRRDLRAAVPAAISHREGEPVRWRVSAPGDSAVPVRVTRRGGTPGGETMLLRRMPGSIFAETRGVAAGVYDVEAAGGRSLLVVNAARELVPAGPSVRSGPAGRAATAGAAPRLRQYGLAYAVIVLLLCVEWVLRRRRGLR